MIPKITKSFLVAPLLLLIAGFFELQAQNPVAATAGTAFGVYALLGAITSLYSISQTRKLNILPIMTILGLLVLGNQAIQAQVSNLLNPTYGYTFLNTTSTYTSLGATGTVFQSGATLNTDGVSTAIALPFTFTYNGIKENTIYISNNGFITFATAPATGGYAPLSTGTTSGYDGAIAGAGMNCVASTAAGAVPEIRYGSSGGDFIVQFQDIGQFGLATMRMTFQIILKADAKTIQIVYGPNNVGVASAVQCQVGLRGTNDEDWNNRTLASGGNWNTAGGAAGTANASGMTLTATSTLPVSGRTFQWSPTAYTPTYLANPAGVVQEFTTWVNGAGPANVPSTNWATNGYGNASWQIDNTTNSTTVSGWTSTSGPYSPVDYLNAVGGHSARFHSYAANAPQVGYLDYYVDMSTITGTATLDFYHINTSGTDILQVFLSTDGGSSFTQIGANIGTAATWTARSISLGATNSATTIIRFKATSDFGATDIGIDHVVITPPPALPTITNFTPNIDLCIGGGQTVTITGTNFTGTTAVTFNGVNAASFTVVSSTTITAVTPAGLSAGIITVTNPAGSANSAAYTVIANPTASVSPTTATICSGTPVTLTANGGGTYAWSPTTGLDVSNAAVVNASPAATTTYTVTVANAAGCTATASATVTVAALVPAFSAIASPASVCIGGTSSLNANVASNVTTYTFANSTSPYTPLSGGTNSTATGDDGIQTDVPIGFTFNYNGTNFTTFGISTNGTIQLGGTATSFSNALISNSNVIAPMWDDNNRTTGSISYLLSGSPGSQVMTIDWNNVAIGGSGSTGTPINQFQIQLFEGTNVVKFSYGTLSSANALTASIGISGNIGQFMSVTPAATPTTSTVTENAGINSVVNIPSGTVYTFTPPVYTYSWSPSAGLTPNATSASVTTPALTSTTTYTVTVSNTAGCTATSSVTVTTTPLTANATATPTTICAGQSTTISAGATGGGTPYSYLWDTGATTATITPSPATTTTYSVTVTDNCGATVTSSVAVNVNPTPTASASSNSPVCVGSPINLNVTTDVGTTFAWSGPSSFTAALQNPTISAATAANAGVYNVTVSLGVCSATATTTVAINPAPVVTVAASPTSVCSGGTSQLSTVIATPAVNKYAFSTSTGATLDPMTGANTILTTSNDDTPNVSPLNIGFAFNFNGTDYTQYSVSPDGWILLGGATAISQFTNSTISTTNTPKIYPYWDDVATGTTGNVKTLVTGTAPNRIFIVQWFVTIPRNTTGAANSTFQAWLYEGSNKIEYRYGTMATSTMDASVGMTASPTNYQSVTIASGTVSTTVPFDANTTQPASGTMYTFIPGTYSYSWSDPTSATTSGLSVTPTATTTYTVTVTNTATGCTTTATTTVTVNPATAGITNNTGSTELTCSLTAISVTATGGGTYAWSNGTTTAANSLTAAGTYTVTVTATNGCTATASIDITSNTTAPTAGITNNTGSTELTCSLTAISVTATGGGTYAWSNGTTTAANSLTAAGTYTVTVTATNGCTATASIDITSNTTAPTAGNY
jgi:hypothetical protein